jgi:hypothetical protein
MRFLIVAAFLALAGGAAQGQANERPQVSVKPYTMMQKLAPLAGRWSMTTEITNDGGNTWSKTPASEVTLSFRHKGMLLAEIPAEISAPGFHMETYLSYDQYRNVYRKAAIDDVWGVMDMYEGAINGDTLILTNLKAGTSFPVGEEKWRHFRLHVELKTPARTMNIEKSDDGGKSWQPAFRVRYQKIEP